jgi:hypothetical protein
LLYNSTGSYSIFLLKRIPFFIPITYFEWEKKNNSTV